MKGREEGVLKGWGEYDLNQNDEKNGFTNYLAISFPTSHTQREQFCKFYSQIYSKHVVCLVSCQAVYYVQSEPKFTDKVTEAIFVVIPGAVKITRAIHSLLRDCPPPIGSSLVTKYIKGTWTSWVDCINTADLWTGFVQLSTVLAVRSNIDDNNHNNTWKWVRGVNTRTRIENHNYMSPMSSCMSLLLVFLFPLLLSSGKQCSLGNLLGLLALMVELQESQKVPETAEQNLEERSRHAVWSRSRYDML